MAWIFGDSFDFYAAIADAGTHWDSAANLNLVAGRFTGSQAIGFLSSTAAVQLVKASSSNDVTHHIVCGFEQTAALSGTVLGEYIQLLDGTTGQCCIVFRSDGTILLTSGTPAGSVLATYSSAFAANVWYGFEFEITINNTTGVFKVRKNGNTSDDFSATSLNTRGGTANNYANKVQIGKQANTAPFGSANVQLIDDFLWFNTSGAAPNTWVGDIRAVQLMPNGDASSQFSKFPIAYTMGLNTAGTSVSESANVCYSKSYTAPVSGTVPSIVVGINAGVTGHMICGLYAADNTNVAGGPGTLLATSNVVTNPVLGPNTFTFASPPTITKNTVYHLAVLSDVAFAFQVPNSNSSTIWSVAQTYAGGFPSNSATVVSSFPSFGNWYLLANITPSNATLVSEAQQDGLTSYVFDSVVGHADFYNVTDLPTVPASIIGVVTRGFVAKSDAGAKSAQLQLKSGATTVQSTTLVLSTSFVYTSRVDTTDPNTGSAWTPAAVNAVQVGPYVTA